MKLAALILKDLKNSLRALWPSIFLGVPLILLLSFFRESFKDHDIHWLAGFWLSFFVGLNSLFYRSFGFEHRHESFLIYQAFRVPKLRIFWSQAVCHWFVAILMAAAYVLIAFILWSPYDADPLGIFGLAVLSAAILCPLGSLLGLMLQLEREFLFGLVFFPLSTPVILACFELSLAWSEVWLSVLGIFAVMSAFLSSLFFEFFFDELS